jgi:hypothetical protein
VLAYLVIERRLHLRQERERREEVVGDVLEIVQRELEFNVTRAQALVAHLPRGQIPYPAFDANGWRLISQAPVLTAMHPDSLDILTKTYNRLRAANELYWEVYDLLNGSTAILAAFLATSEAADDPLSRFDELRLGRRDRLVERIEELRPVLDEAVARVARDLSSRRI